MNAPAPVAIPPDTRIASGIRWAYAIGADSGHAVSEERKCAITSRWTETWGTLPILEVALETGFGDLSHFTTSFRRLFGTSPGRYRAASSCTEAVSPVIPA
jgi:AraC-like DNA-binding protein